MFSFCPLAIFQNLGMPELIIIGIITLLIFGPRLPSVMRSIGKGIVEFKKGLRDTGEEVRKEIEASDQPANKQIDHKS
ncbi:MAG TPA: twin-arginine translocase TatA/TatE family subunit [Planctomycetota bacterium]|nr:twin-arginine translocase TatA/TatE family subunit [Planctomycetota bacterium]HRR83210.1 twin-arginine translocase TatA/TatE family subunit [Planctomycetota bacterium]HRT97222.1 twin-arginine translocase TatA/TatE family subunit [Planctomycetota bacterium]